MDTKDCKARTVSALQKPLLEQEQKGSSRQEGGSMTFIDILLGVCLFFIAGVLLMVIGGVMVVTADRILDKIIKIKD